MTKQPIAAIRKRNLIKWFSSRPIPTKEKSYLSQLMGKNDTPFGEKAARRLEKTYEMGDFYLDTDIDGSQNDDNESDTKGPSPRAEKLIAIITKLDQIGGMDDVFSATEVLLKKALPIVESARGPEELQSILTLYAGNPELVTAEAVQTLSKKMKNTANNKKQTDVKTRKKTGGSGA